MTTDNVYTALYRFQGLVRGVKKDAKNAHFRSSYATLEAVTDTIRPHMQDCGLLWIQSPGKVHDNAIEVTTVIVHPESGSEYRSTMEMPLAKRDPQGTGSAMTYAMRYSLMAVLGLPPTDDDAEMAIDRNNERPAMDVPAKSSASLKRDGAWEALKRDLDNDLADCHSAVSLSKLRAEYREKARENGWPKAWLLALANEFDVAEEALTKTVDSFPGDDPIRNHPMMAG